MAREWIRVGSQRSNRDLGHTIATSLEPTSGADVENDPRVLGRALVLRGAAIPSAQRLVARVPNASRLFARGQGGPRFVARVATVALSIVVVSFGLVLGPSSAAAADTDEDSRPSPLHLDLDFALGVAQVEFPAVALPDDLPVDTGQAPGSRTTEVVRMTAAAGFGGLALEGALTTSLSGGDYLGWSAGLRLESSWDSSVAIAFRVAYVQRIDVEGEGVRFGIGIVGRPVLALSLYAEAWTEATTIPDGMQMTGALFTYVVSGTAGVRVSFR